MQIPQDEEYLSEAGEEPDTVQKESRRTIAIILGSSAVLGILVCVAIIVFGMRLRNNLDSGNSSENADTGAIDSDGYITTRSGLKYRILEYGDGPHAQAGDDINVKYRGTFADGTEFDAGTLSFTLGQGYVIAGWDEGLALLNEGDKAEFIVPPQLAYGANDYGPIPGNSTLIFEVELLEVDQE